RMFWVTRRIGIGSLSATFKHQRKKLGRNGKRFNQRTYAHLISLTAQPAVTRGGQSQAAGRRDDEKNGTGANGFPCTQRRSAARRAKSVRVSGRFLVMEVAASLAIWEFLVIQLGNPYMLSPSLVPSLEHQYIP